MDIGYLSAFLGGLLSLLSPCSIMLLPAFFAYAFNSPGKLISRTWMFFLGLLVTLVPLGVFSGTVGSLLGRNRHVLITVVAAIVIVIGVVQLLG
ncbi:cytochrome c biogenesis protein CcdA, partial [Cutibacterium granulosum]